MTSPHVPSRAAAALPVGAAALLCHGTLAATWCTVLAPWATALAWPALGLLARRTAALGGLRAAVALAQAYGATLLAVLLVRFEPASAGSERAHAAFGEHEVLQRAGLPWPGVEGHGRGGGVERIPFTMGVDALLVDATLFALLFVWLQRRTPAAALRARLLPACAFAALAGLLGGGRLVVLFD
ncbi:MAG: hypothetical protein JNL08_15185 [Planctomycetes bacterium]|nr:hypothetical protein [Planctomycetota bacterium]